MFHAKCFGGSSPSCPRHSCISCINRKHENWQTADHESDEYQLGNCIKCSKTFHISDLCLPAGTVVLDDKKQILCPDHRDRNDTLLKKMSKTKKNRNIKVGANFCRKCPEKKGKLVTCEKCPASYHVNCAGSEFDENFPFHCFDCEKNQQLYPYDVLWVKYGGYRWWPASIVPDSESTPKLKESDRMFGDFKIRFVGTWELAWMNRGRAFRYRKGDNRDTRFVDKAGSRLSIALDIVEHKMIEINKTKEEDFKKFENAVRSAASEFNESEYTESTSLSIEPKIILEPAAKKYLPENQSFKKVTSSNSGIFTTNPISNPASPCQKNLKLEPSEESDNNESESEQDKIIEINEIEAVNSSIKTATKCIQTNGSLVCNGLVLVIHQNLFCY